MDITHASLYFERFLVSIFHRHTLTLCCFGFDKIIYSQKINKVTKIVGLSWKNNGGRIASNPLILSKNVQNYRMAKKVGMIVCQQLGAFSSLN